MIRFAVYWTRYRDKYNYDEIDDEISVSGHIGVRRHFFHVDLVLWRGASRGLV